MLRASSPDTSNKRALLGSCHLFLGCSLSGGDLAVTAWDERLLSFGAGGFPSRADDLESCCSCLPQRPSCLLACPSLASDGCRQERSAPVRMLASLESDENPDLHRVCCVPTACVSSCPHQVFVLSPRVAEQGRQQASQLYWPSLSSPCCGDVPRSECTDLEGGRLPEVPIVT